VKDSNIRVALRADASKFIGLGHVKRCLALTEALRAIGVEARLVTRDLGVETAAIAVAAGIERVALPAPIRESVGVDRVPHAEWAGVGWQLDADQCVEALAHWKPDWVVVDHYAFDSRWHRQVSKGLNTRMAVIDDLADRDLSAELLVDPNLSDNHRKKYSGRLPERAALLGGPRFALLGPAYSAVAPLVIRETVRSIGIFMGGVDAGNLSSLALRACREDGGFCGPVEIVVTRAYPHSNALNALANKWADTSVVCDLPDLAAFFSRHDLQIGAGGGAAWERCCVGVPTIAFAAAANQDAVLPALVARGAVVLIAGPALPNEQAIGSAVRSLLSDPLRRMELSERSRALVDGLGAKRVALRLAAPWMSVRPATMCDAEIMYQWRNHPATRIMSLNSGEISWSDHQQWLEASLQEAGRCILVGRLGNADVGIVRFDARTEEQFVVSLYLDPALHGLSLGRLMLLAGEAYMLARRGPIRHFLAAVLQKNESSMRLFASCGYHLEQGLWKKNVGPGRGEAN
jgi:UDP-2,4-diacetamido-2,4,6-trideoxy-beta-L-altropyranose hydrolase